LAKRISNDATKSDKQRMRANNLLRKINFLRDQLLRGDDVKKIILTAISIGEEREILSTGPWEPLVSSGARSRDGLKKGREKKTQKLVKRRSKITQAVEKRLAENSKETLTSARNYVAGQLGISCDSVRRATRKLKPKKNKI
jgi:hypothetical protein